MYSGSSPSPIMFDGSIVRLREQGDSRHVTVMRTLGAFIIIAGIFGHVNFYFTYLVKHVSTKDIQQ